MRADLIIAVLTLGVTIADGFGILPWGVSVRQDCRSFQNVELQGATATKFTLPQDQSMDQGQGWGRASTECR
ncbi:unnamed protein product, partial [Discosporangium mesarthrocarpum]